MNAKFLALEVSKRERIINAGCHEFYKWGYKASMQVIADEAGISKSLLFHYFKNKKEFFLYLYAYAVDTIMGFDPCLEETDLFVILHKMTRGKCELLRRHPLMSKFLIKSGEIQDEAIVYDINQFREKLATDYLGELIGRIDQSKFKEGIDVNKLVDMIVWSGEGLARRKTVKAINDEVIEALESGFFEVLAFYKQLTYKDEYL